MKIYDITMQTALEDSSTYHNKRVKIHDILDVIVYDKRVNLCSIKNTQEIDDPFSRWTMFDGKGNSIGIRMIDDESLSELNISSLEGVLQDEQISNSNCPQLEFQIMYLAVGELSERLLK